MVGVFCVIAGSLVGLIGRVISAWVGLGLLVVGSFMILVPVLLLRYFCYIQNLC